MTEPVAHSKLPHEGSGRARRGRVHTLFSTVAISLPLWRLRAALGAAVIWPAMFARRRTGEAVTAAIGGRLTAESTDARQRAVRPTDQQFMSR